MPGKRQPGEASPGAPIALPARRSAPCRRRLPPRPGLPSGPACRHCCQARKKPPDFRGPRSQAEELSKVSQLQLLKSLAGLPSRGAATPDAAPMAEWGRRTSGTIVSLRRGQISSILALLALLPTLRKRHEHVSVLVHELIRRLYNVRILHCLNTLSVMCASAHLGEKSPPQTPSFCLPSSVTRFFTPYDLNPCDPSRTSSSRSSRTACIGISAGRRPFFPLFSSSENRKTDTWERVAACCWRVAACCWRHTN